MSFLKSRIFRGSLRGGRMGPPTSGMMEGLLVSNSPFLGDFLYPPLVAGHTNVVQSSLFFLSFFLPYVRLTSPEVTGPKVKALCSGYI